MKSDLLLLKGRSESLTKGYLKLVERLFKSAIGAFVEAVADSIPVDTGMSLASLSPLAAKIRQRKNIASLISGGGIKRGHYESTVSKYPVPAENAGKFKSRALGARLGQKAYSIVLGNQNNPVFTFEFDIVVLQHYINEENGQSWNSIEKGEKAFLKYIDENAESILGDPSNWRQT